MSNIEKFPHGAVRLEPSGPPEGTGDVVDVFTIVRLVRRRIGLIVLVSALLVIAGVPLILSMERDYYGEMRLLLRGPLPAPGEEKAEGVEAATEVERLWSREVAERVIDRLDLAERPEFNPALQEPSLVDTARMQVRGLLMDTEEENGPEADPFDTIVSAFYAHLRIQRNGASNVIQVGFRSKDPFLAAEVPQAILDTYREASARRLEDRVARADRIASRRIDEQARRAGAARSAVTTFTRAHEGDLQRSAEAPQTVSTLSDKLSDILRERAELSSRLVSAEAAVESGDVATADSDLHDAPVLADLRRALHEQRLAYGALSDSHGPAHADVVAAERRITDTEAALVDEFEREIRSLKARLAVLDDADRAVTTALEAARATLLGVRRSETRLERLEARAREEEEALEVLEDWRRNLLAGADLPPVELEVLSPATVPLLPQGKSRLFYLVALAIASGFAAFTLACAVEVLDRSVRSPSQLSGRMARLPTTLIPRLPGRAAARAARGRSSRRGSDPQLRDAMRSLLLRLETPVAGEVPQSLAVTSALPGTGVSLVSEALAREFALSGRLVLLVEAGWRPGPRRFRLRREAARPGLGDVVADGVPVADVLRRDPASGVDVLPWGERAGSLFEARSAMAKILQHARAENRFVIFDCPAVLASTESLLVAGRADRTLLLLKWGATGRREAEAAYERLAEVAGQGILLGINMVRPRRHALYAFPDAASCRPAEAPRAAA